MTTYVFNNQTYVPYCSWDKWSFLLPQQFAGVDIPTVDEADLKYMAIELTPPGISLESNLEHKFKERLCTCGSGNPWHECGGTDYCG